MDPRTISISDYDYTLPDDRIARFPVSPRDHSQLLVSHHGTISDHHFFNLPDLLPSGTLMIMNNTRVIRARILFQKSTGALIEVFLLEPHEPADYEQNFQQQSRCVWQCLVGNLKKWKDGPLSRQLSVDGTSPQLTATHCGQKGTSQLIEFSWDSGCPFSSIIDAAGELPIPPYLKRQTQASDLTTYQTVYSRIKGSVAAPTAGLHFTPEVLQRLDQHNIERCELTLHVGAGTFRPVKSSHMSGHAMHTEHIAVGRDTLLALLKHHCSATAVGTTSVRTLESLYYLGKKVMDQPTIDESLLHVSQWEPYEQPEPTTIQVAQAVEALVRWLDARHQNVLHASTQIIIAPGYHFKTVARLITNFHQPQSTLLLLVSAFTGGQWRPLYRHALDHGYRFLSYGDSSLLFAPDKE